MTYMTEIELGCAVDYDYQPSEPMTRHEPGCDSSVTVNRVMLGNLDLIDYLSPMQKQELAQKILEHEQGMAADDIDLRADREYEERRSA